MSGMCILFILYYIIYLEFLHLPFPEKVQKQKLGRAKLKTYPKCVFKILVDCDMSKIEVASSVSVHHVFNLRGQIQSRDSTLEFLENLI